MEQKFTGIIDSDEDDTPYDGPNQSPQKPVNGSNEDIRTPGTPTPDDNTPGDNTPGIIEPGQTYSNINISNRG